MAHSSSGNAKCRSHNASDLPVGRRGYKLHLDVADTQIPISAIPQLLMCTIGNVAIPLMTMSSQCLRYWERSTLGQVFPVLKAISVPPTRSRSCESNGTSKLRSHRPHLLTMCFTACLLASSTPAVSHANRIHS